MKYVFAPDGVYQRTLDQNEVFEFSKTVKQSPKQLTDEEKQSLSVSVLKLVTPPPYNPDTEQRIEVDPVLVDGEWAQQWSVESIVPTDPTELQAFKDNLTAKKKSDLASLRFTKETAGIVFNGMPVATDRPSQAMLTGAYTTVQITPEILIDWKGESGWVQLNKAAIEMLSQAVSSHIQACFTNEKNISALIDAATTVADLEAIDLNGGWPV